MKSCGVLPVLLAIVATYGGPLAAQSASDSLLRRYGQFEMGDDGQKLILGRSVTKAFHVCMQNGEHAVPLRVRHDGKETVVQPGECKFIEASRIKLATVGKLDEGMTLIGTRKSVPRIEDLKKFTTEVQVARQAPVGRPEDEQLAGVVP